MAKSLTAEELKRYMQRFLEDHEIDELEDIMEEVGDEAGVGDDDDDDDDEVDEDEDGDGY